MTAPSLAGADVLVTGGAGFVGSHLVRALLARGATVRLLEAPGVSLEKLGALAARVTPIAADLTDAGAAASAIAPLSPSHVIHLAGWTGGRGRATDPDAWRKSFAVNLHGTLHLLAALEPHTASIRRIVRTGTMEEYGDGPVPFRETERERAVSPYSASMVAATQAAHALAAQRGVPLVTVRPSIIYGPGGDESFFIPALIRACLANEDFAMTRGAQTGDFVHVEDVAEALIAAAFADGAAGGIFNAGTGVETPVRVLAERVVAMTGTTAALRIGALPSRAGESARRFMDQSETARTLGWRAGIALDDGLARTIEWFKAGRAAPA
jgi:UDP-glucose 4-epimerase